MLMDPIPPLAMEAHHHHHLNPNAGGHHNHNGGLGVNGVGGHEAGQTAHNGHEVTNQQLELEQDREVNKIILRTLGINARGENGHSILFVYFMLISISI